MERSDERINILICNNRNYSIWAIENRLEKKKIKDAQGPVRTTAKDPPFMLSES